MATVTLKINEKTNYGKALMKLIKIGINEKKGVEIIEAKSPYNPEFVKMVKTAAANKKRYLLKNVDELWKSL
ncbi:MAG: hypothetical protein C0459_13355 [Chitinophaga sp.]|jgi:hypothetical protein|nr:hypothetical protein [Chitinophaga sp.]